MNLRVNGRPGNVISLAIELQALEASSVSNLDYEISATK